MHVCHNSPAVGKELGSLKLSQVKGLTLLAISRGSDVKANPPTNYLLEENDILFFLGQSSKLQEIMDAFREQDSCEAEK